MTDRCSCDCTDAQSNIVNRLMFLAFDWSKIVPLCDVSATNGSCIKKQLSTNQNLLNARANSRNDRWTCIGCKMIHLPHFWTELDNVWHVYCKVHILAATWQNQQNDCAPSEAQSDQSLRCALNGWLTTQAFFMRTAKTLIRLRGYKGWSESSLGAQSLCLFCHVAAHIV